MCTIINYCHIFVNIATIILHKKEIWDMSARETVKIMLLKRCMTIKILAEKMSELTGKKYTRQSLSNKISRNSLRYDEVEVIAKILNYKIVIEDID